MDKLTVNIAILMIEQTIGRQYEVFKTSSTSR